MKLRLFFTSLLCLITLAYPSFAKEKPKKEKAVDPYAKELESTSEARTFKDEKGRFIAYRLFKPKNLEDGKKYPLVISFHGVGSRGNDNIQNIIGNTAFLILSKPENQEKYPCIIVAPQCPKPLQWANTPWKDGSYSLDNVPISEPMELALGMLESVKNEFPIDETRIYATGLSMGGFGTWDLLMRRPEMFAAAIPVCGGADPSKAESLKNISIWTFHGAKDKVIPVSSSREMVDAIKKVGGNIKYTEYPNGRHIIWNQAWQEEGIIDWLFAQQKKTVTQSALQ